MRLSTSQQRLENSGINLIGFLTSEFGIGQSARLTAKSLSTVSNLQWSGYNYCIGNHARQEDNSISNISDSIVYSVSLICINAADFPRALTNLPLSVLGTYRIGMWYWELESFPDEWNNTFDLVDELWAPTHFIEDCLKKKARCPVVYMPPCITLDPVSAGINRSFFSLPTNAFLFISMYDHYSIAQRKNPQAAILAFQKAFAPNDSKVGLVLKVNNISASDAEISNLEKLVGNYQNIYLIVNTLKREEVIALINCCDVAVSLHRSEGLGLLCQEAMFLGKPVIATGWSGNMDFMNEDNSCLVKYDFVTIDKDYYPYKKGQRWAEADIFDASEKMIRLFQDREYYNRIALAGQKTMIENYSPDVCGERMAQRLNLIFAQLERNKQ